VPELPPIEFGIPILVFVSVMLIGAAVISARLASRRRVRDRLHDLDPEGLATQPDGFSQGGIGLLGHLGGLLAIGGPSGKLRAELAKAGFHSSTAPQVYLGAKHGLLAVGLITGGIVAAELDPALHVKIFIVCASAALLYFIPNLYVTRRRIQRTADVRRHLPDMVDLLEVCVASGMGLDMAWNSVADEIRGVSTTLADEMALTNLEMHLGSARSAAMRHMSERTGVAELSSLVALLVQSDRFGTSLSDTLKVFAGSMREERGQQAQESAEKMAVKLLFPMVVFIFPAVLVVLVGPAAIALFKEMAGH